MIGDRIELTVGFETLVPGEDYRYLGQDHERGRCWLVRFLEPDGPIRADLLSVTAEAFERENRAGNLRVRRLEGADKLPPWNRTWSGLEVADLDANGNTKVPYSERVSRREAQFGDAVRDFKAWLCTDDPVKELNRRARQAHQNETRYRTQVLAYLVSGCDPLAICPPYHRGGHRKHRPVKVKQGRSSLAFGRNAGSVDDKVLTKKYLDGYYRYVEIGRPLTKIYDRIMVKDLKCRVVKGRGRSQLRWQPPTGQKIYTYEQFRYRVRLTVGAENVQKNRYGATRHRTRNTPSEGRFTQCLANLMEKVEADAFQIQERPRGYLEGSVLDPLWQVTGLDVLSSYGVGIGFSLGGERSAAYRMMLFCMSVPKDYFCRLWGLEIEPDEWDSEGLPPHPALDRGPGAKYDLFGELSAIVPVREIVAAYSGQGKASVESSNPKKVRTEGQPAFVASTLTPVALCRKQILEFIARNKRADVSRRIEPIREMVGVAPTPMGIWNFFNDRLRNDSLPIRIESAVRNFLTPVTFKVEEDCVTLHGRRYSSKSLKASGILRRFFNGAVKATTISGRVMDLCVRHAWIDFEGKLYELDAQLRFRGDEESLYVSLAELEEFEAALAEAVSETVETRRAASGEAIQRFEDQTAENWNSERRKAGRAKRTAQSRGETRDARRTESHRKSA